MNKKILLIGNNGFLGSSIATILSKKDISITSFNRSLCDLSKPITNEFKDFMKIEKFNYMVICAAVTDVEKCFQDHTISNLINVISTKAILDIAKLNGTIPVFFSSDYVFSGKNHPYLEDEQRVPQTVYGSQKLAVETYIEMNFENYLIFRTSKLMSKTSHPKNILVPLIRDLSANKKINCFIDQILNPVFVEDIAEVLKLSFDKNLSGIFHLGTKSIFTRFTLAKYMAKELGLDESLIAPIRMGDIEFSEKRPTNNTLACQKIEKAINFKFSEIAESIPELKELLICF